MALTVLGRLRARRGDPEADAALEEACELAVHFWHPDLVTLHVWVWYHNPAGLYSGTNPLVQPFNRG